MTLTLEQAIQLAIRDYQQGRLAESEQTCRIILGQNPSCPEALQMLGILASRVGNWAEAVRLIEMAISHRPDDAYFHANLTRILTDAGEFERAVISGQRAVELNPRNADTQFNLAIAMQALNRQEESILSYRKAIALNPSHTKAMVNLASIFKDCGDIEEAIRVLAQPQISTPEAVVAHSNYCYLLHFHPDFGPRALSDALAKWNRQHAIPLMPKAEFPGSFRLSGRRLRIGYISPNFQDHVIGRNLLPLFRHHNHEEFEIFCYAQVSRPDDMTLQFQKHASTWRNIVGLSDDRVASMIRDDGIDILVDLTLHLAGNRLLVFARKPAPIQITFAGYPGSTGLSAMDYRLSDSYLDPQDRSDADYSEQTLRLPDSFWCYDPLDQREISVNSLPALESGIITFSCLNNFCKVNKEILAIWAQILGRVPNSQLLLLAKPGLPRERTTTFMVSLGIDPGRIQYANFQARNKYLELYHRADLGLDSFPYNGHSTSLDSFWMGVPVVTLVGQTAVSRAGWSQLSNLGLQELAGHSPEQFIKIAVELAGDLPRLSNLRKSLRHRMEHSPLMDAQRFTRGIEMAFHQVWQNRTDDK